MKRDANSPLTPEAVLAIASALQARQRSRQSRATLLRNWGGR